MRIEIRGLHKTYNDGTVALRPLDLEFGEGMLGLLGPNGAGKTTFLSMLVLAREPTGGRRRYDQLDAARAGDRPSIRRRLGFLPQDFAPIAHLTGFEYLVHCAELRDTGLGRRALVRRAHELLEVVGLSRTGDRPSGGYSGGMKRRLGIAQALIHGPSLLVIDEPTAGLDPEERIRFRNLVSEVADHTAVVLSTHIVEDIEATCPRIVAIASGQLQFDGAPTELMRRVDGCLWAVEPERAEADGLAIISRRVGDDGKPLVVVHAERSPAGAIRREPTLEEAYSALLASIAGESAGAGAAAAS